MIPTTRKPYTVIALRHGGTHFIIPTVRFLTGKTVYSPKGDNALNCEPSSVVIVFLRDPRNWLASSYKWKNGRTEVAPDDNALAVFMAHRRKHKSTSPVEYLKRWTDRWLDWPGALTVRFEDLLPPNGLAETTRIAAFIGATRDPAEVHEEVYGKSGTYTGQPSDFRQWFGPASTAAWEAYGGPEILERMGYR